MQTHCAGRAQAIHHRRPYSLKLSILYPPEARWQGSSRAALQAAYEVARLHSILDNRFLDAWNDLSNDISQERSQDWRQRLLHFQDGALREEPRVQEAFPPSQKLNIIVTFHWARAVVWSTGYRHDLIDVGNVEDILTPQYGLECARRVAGAIPHIHYQDKSRVLDVMGIVSSPLH